MTFSTKIPLEFNEFIKKLNKGQVSNDFLNIFNKQSPFLFFKNEEYIMCNKFNEKVKTENINSFDDAIKFLINSLVVEVDDDMIRLKLHVNISLNHTVK